MVMSVVRTFLAPTPKPLQVRPKIILCLIIFYNCSLMMTTNSDKVDHDEKSNDDYKDEEIIIIKFAVSFSRMS
jgi:hypothetical protein